MKKLTFNSSEVKFLNDLAEARNNKNNLKGNRLFTTTKTSLEIHTLGVWSEYAVAQAYGIQMNTTIYPNGGDKGAPDLVIPGYGNVEVKSTTYTIDREPYLRVESKRCNDEIDTYFLVYVDIENCSATIYGWASRDEVKAKTPRSLNASKNLPINYLVKCQELHSTNEVNSKVKVQKSTPKVETTTSTSMINLTSFEIGDKVKLPNQLGPEMFITTIHAVNVDCIYAKGDEIATIRLNPKVLIKV